MKMISNIASLESELAVDYPSWKQEVYDKLGVWIRVTGSEQSQWELVSACCPYCAKSLDEDVSYDWSNREANTPSIEIHSLDALIEYIRDMESYQMIIKDVSLGSFTKSELFWAAEQRIMKANLDHGSRVYAIRGIYGPGDVPFNDMKADDLWIDTAAVDFDEIPGIYLGKVDRQSLDDAVACIAAQLEEFRNQQDWTEDFVPRFKFEPHASYRVPKTLEDLKKAYQELK